MNDVHMTAKVLRRAAEIVEQGWCQRLYALSVKGVAVDQYAAEADRWCVYGALDRAQSEIVGHHVDAGCDVTRFVRRATGAGSLTDWNDASGRTQSEVADALRRAASLAEGRP